MWSRVTKSFAPHVRKSLSALDPASASQSDMPAASTKAKGLPKGRPFVFCGPERIRTPRLLSANEALYQMSYGPKRERG